MVLGINQTIGDLIVRRRFVGIYIKEIVTLAVRYGAVTAVLAHNHPSGECTPSRQDIETTQWVFAALENVEVRLLDHVIVSGQDYLSLAQVGLLPELFGA